jgi:hypothetical protein
MTLYGDDRNKLSVPFVRPEDEAIFKNLRTAVIVPELKPNASLFTLTEQNLNDSPSINVPSVVPVDGVKAPADQHSTSNAISAWSVRTAVPVLVESESQKQVPGNSAKQSTANGLVSSQAPNDSETEETAVDDDHQQELRPDHIADTLPTGRDNRISPGNIWGTWRAGGFPTDSDINGEHIPTSGYQRPSRGARSMKVLKPSKTSHRGRSSAAARTGASYEPPIQHISGEFRRKSQAGASDSNGGLRWEAKRTASDEKKTKDSRLITNMSRSSNPVGGASAFAWMNPGKAITTSARAE